MNKKTKFIIIKTIMYVAMFIITLLLYISYNKILIGIQINKIIDYRTLKTPGEFYVSIDEEEKQIDYEKVLLDSLEKISKIPHVIEVYNAEYQLINLDSSFEYEITLHRGSGSYLPELTKGRNFKSNETNVAICPESMYFSKDGKSKAIEGKEILNSSFSVTYYDYTREPFENPEKNNEYQKQFKVIGLYDNSKYIESDNICYIPISDIEEICDTELSWNNNYVKPLNIVVDKYTHIEKVKEGLYDLGFDSFTIPTYEEEIFIREIRIMSLLLTSLSIVFILFITNILIKRYTH